MHDSKQGHIFSCYKSSYSVRKSKERGEIRKKKESRNHLKVKIKHKLGDESVIYKGYVA
jgi:hypothetical protein